MALQVPGDPSSRHAAAACAGRSPDHEEALVQRDPSEVETEENTAWREKESSDTDEAPEEPLARLLAGGGVGETEAGWGWSGDGGLGGGAGTGGGDGGLGQGWGRIGGGAGTWGGEMVDWGAGLGGRAREACHHAVE